MHLEPLIRSSGLVFWSVRSIRPGDSRKEQIHHQLETADVLLFLVSANLFADSDAEYWMECALLRQRNQGVPVIPILLRPTLLSGSPLGALMPLPADGRAINQWRSRDQAWVEVVQGLERLIMLSGKR